jgi:hypothetical protein
LTVTFFPDKSAQSRRCIDLTLPQLAEQIRLETGLSKLTLPWLKLTILGDARSPKGCLRTNANAQQITGIEVEHDAGTATFDEANLRMLRRGEIKGRQACAGAPWVIKTEDLAGFASGKRRKPPLTQNATQQVFDFQ